MKFGNRARSIRFRIWMFLLLFTAIILGLMWFLQIFFLNNYYEDMKIDRTKELAAQISSVYKNSGTDAAIKECNVASDGDDLFISIVDNGERLYPGVDDPAYAYELGEIDEQLRESSASKLAYEGTITNETTNRETYYHVEYLDQDSSKIVPDKKDTKKDDEATVDTDNQVDPGTDTESNPATNKLLYVLSPLDPVTSTTAILQRQMGYIMLISLILSIFIALFLTRLFANPITRLTRQAHKLAQGQYGTAFPVDSGLTEIDELGTTLNTMSMELERAAMTQRDLMANVSHDLRTPLTMIKSYAEMVRDLSGDIPEKRNEHLNVIIEESDRLNTLVNDMLALSAMQSGTLKLDIRPFNIYGAVESIMAPYHVMEEKEGYHIVFNCKQDIFVEGDEARIKQVISNLLSNGVKYCGEDKTVYINIRRWGEKVHLEIVDHGVGIKPEELKHIWDRHYMTSSNHVRPTKGSGLGLSIVKEILQMHDAKFGVESKVGKGTTVWFELKSARDPESN